MELVSRITKGRRGTESNHSLFLLLLQEPGKTWTAGPLESSLHESYDESRVEEKKVFLLTHL